MLARISIDGSEFACVTGWPGQGGPEATTVPRCGWAGLKNLGYQQNMATLLIAVLVGGTMKNLMEHLALLVSNILRDIASMHYRSLCRVDA